MAWRGGAGRRAGSATPTGRAAAPPTEEATRDAVLTALHAEHAGPLLGFIRQYVDDRERAEDIAQETFLRAWRHITDVDLGRNPRAYLFTTARNLLTDQWRSNNRRPRLVHDEQTLEQVPTGDAVDAALDGWLVAEAVRRLTPDHRAVVQALYFDSLTVADAATRLQVAPGTVKSRSYYAVRALRVTFEEMGVMR